MCSHVTDEESENVGLNVLANIDGAEEVAAKMCKEAQCSELRGSSCPGWVTWSFAVVTVFSCMYPFCILNINNI